MRTGFCIKKNILSDKNSILNKKDCYLFLVDSNANKIEIKNCISNFFSVKVKSVNTSNILTKGSTKYAKGYQINKKITNYKKAYVYLYPGEELKFNNLLK